MLRTQRWNCRVFCLCRHATHWVQRDFSVPLQRTEPFLRSWGFKLPSSEGFWEKMLCGIETKQSSALRISGWGLISYPWKKIFGEGIAPCPGEEANLPTSSHREGREGTEADSITAAPLHCCQLWACFWQTVNTILSKIHVMIFLRLLPLWPRHICAS